MGAGHESNQTRVGWAVSAAGGEDGQALGGQQGQHPPQLDRDGRWWADRIMAANGMYDTVKQAIQDLIAPDLERIKGELAGVRTELRAELTAVRAELKAINDRIDTLKERVTETNKRLDEALNIRERLAAVEAKLAARA